MSVILPLFWRYDITNIPTFDAETWEVLLWRHEIHDIFPRIRAYVVQNLLFSHYFTTKFDIFSLSLTGDSDFLVIFSSTQNKLSMSGFSKIWSDQIFCCNEGYGSKIFIL